MVLQNQLIVTADDFGFTAGIDLGIADCAEAGGITATCVMTNMPHWHDIASFVERHPDISIGVHWTLTQGKPVLAANRVPSLVDELWQLLLSSRVSSAIPEGNSYSRTT